MSADGIDPEKAVAIRLRSRLAGEERAAWLRIVLAMTTRPVENWAVIDVGQCELAHEGGSGDRTPDLQAPQPAGAGGGGGEGRRDP
ncbi:hypothetical protein, partial [Methylobacterium radiotolerans]|uniref:hypothetical protein n=1 Tax=Methylobacterium radiotolerans TaxID=31998 RepID=UPI000B7868B9